MHKYVYALMMLACGLGAFITLLGTALGRMDPVSGTAITLGLGAMGYAYAWALEDQERMEGGQA